VVAAKHGDERFFAALARDFVNGAAIVFEVTPQLAHLGEVQEDDVQFISSGDYVVPNGWVEQWDWAQPPDNDMHPNAFKGRRQPLAIRPDMAGVDLSSYHNQDAGRARAYTLRYGHFLVGMNMDARYNQLPYRVKTPADFTAGTDLVSGRKMTAPVIIPAGTTVVFYLPNASSPNPPPASPLVFTGLPGNQQVALDWDASSGAQTYTVKRSDASHGPYSVIATGVKNFKYVDTKVNNGSTYYYVLTGTGVTGESDPSPEVKIAVPEKGNLPSPWLDQDIGKTGMPGSASLDDTLFSLTAGGDDIYQGPDSCHFIGQPVTGDCTITVQLKSQRDGNEWSKAGVMLRASLDPNTKIVALLATPGHGVVSLRRADGYREVWVTDIQSPLWLRLSRKGTVVTASTSSDGNTWTNAFTEDIPQLFPTIYIGIAGTAHDNSTTSLTTFDNVSVSTP
jgi:regulation of enolase protein 1 (concanavalin A-like superfamily)